MVDITYEFGAFSFDGICRTVALSLCPLIGQYDGIEPVCYSRNVDLGGNLIFQPGNSNRDDKQRKKNRLTYLAILLLSNAYHWHCGYYHDRHYDLPYSIQIHSSWAEGNRHVLLSLHALYLYGNASCHGYHTHIFPCLSGEVYLVKGGRVACWQLCLYFCSGLQPSIWDW